MQHEKERLNSSEILFDGFIIRWRTSPLCVHMISYASYAPEFLRILGNVFDFNMDK